jgi:hypothetical protein
VFSFVIRANVNGDEGCVRVSLQERLTKVFAATEQMVSVRV